MVDSERSNWRTRSVGVLRSRTVAKLSGASKRQLGYWHRTNLIRAHVLPGGAGYPRLYSWEDYMKVRAAKKLQSQGLSTQRIREQIAFLDSEVPDWAFRDVREFSGSAVYRVTEPSVTYVTARPGRQAVFTELALSVLSELSAEGTLGELKSFDSFVYMDPRVKSGNPVVKGTRIETRFIASLADRGVDETSIGVTYHLSDDQISNAISFERLAA